MEALCECGCGKPVRSVEVTNRSMGRFEGQPNHFLHGHNPRKRGPEYRVESETGCWIWLQGKTGSGYGATKGTVSDSEPAHRVFYERLVGPIPSGRELHHCCGNRRCVNPDHLKPVFPVEHAETKKNVKLSLTKAAEIRVVAKTTQRTHQELADLYGVSRSHISRLLRGEAWVLA